MSENHENQKVIIGNYRIRYNGVSTIVPVDEDGFLLLPDGKKVALAKDQVELLRSDYERRKKEEANAMMLTAPTEGPEDNSAKTNEKNEQSASAKKDNKQENLPSVPAETTSEVTSSQKEQTKKTKSNSEIILAVLISVFATLLIVTGGFLYLVGKGTVTVNRPLNGFVIYDDSTSGAGEGVSYSFNENETLFDVEQEV